MRADGRSPFSETRRKLRRLTASELRQLSEKYDIDQSKLEQIYEELTDQHFKSGLKLES
jgi:ribosomal protein L19E